MYRIKGWHRYQHYKDRCPPWIKLHRELLWSKDWVTLNDSGRVLMIACMLIASQADDPGTVPDDPNYVRRLAYLDHEPDFRPLVKCGFLEPDSEEEETDKETETEEETQATAGRVIASVSKRSNIFKPPTIKEVRGYIAEKGLQVDAADFHDFYASKDWMVGKSKMKDWKAACRRAQKWEQNQKRARQRVGEQTAYPWDTDDYKYYGGCADWDDYMRDHEGLPGPWLRYQDWKEKRQCQ